MSKANAQYSDIKKEEFKPSEKLSKLEPNSHLLHLSVLRQLSNQRAGTASTKTKSEVRGGGKKPWKQKGTGRARAGSSRSPLWVGGGITFGPKPRSFKFNIPQKARNLAIAQALISKSEQIVVLNELPEIKDGKTKNLVGTLKAAGLTNYPLLIIYDSSEPGVVQVKQASGNLQRILLKEHKYVGVHEILKANTVIVTKMALSELETRFSKFLSKKVDKVDKKVSI